jgi:Xaa-Pro aminopeptidase
MRHNPLTAEFYIENRKKLMAMLEPGSLAIFNSNDEMPYSGDQTYRFRQNSDLLWLCGINQELTTLVLFPDAPLPQYREILFLRKTNEKIAIWEGHKYTAEEARSLSGIPTILWNDDFPTVMNLLMNHCRKVYLNLNENDRCAWYVPYRDLRFAREWKEKYPLHQYDRLGPIMARLRAIKSAAEIEIMRTACTITGKAFERILRFIRPGIMEYEIEAEIIHEFIRNGANGHAYHPIIASGKNACVLHYNDNNCECRDGDVILLDFGADYANYAADLTRSVPVNGRFTPRQRQVYDAVLRVMRAAMKMLVPGNYIEKYHAEVGRIMEAELLGLKLLTSDDIARQSPDNPAYKKYFMHGTSHFLGMDVHDIGNRFEPMQAGMVFTCEPGIYIPEEGLGIRIETNVLVTDNGPIDLMADIPVEAEEIEDIMQGVRV